MSSLVSSSHKAALIYDGVHLFSRAVENLITETDLTTPQVGCDNKDSPYDLGDRLLQEINLVSAAELDDFVFAPKIFEKTRENVGLP